MHTDAHLFSVPNDCLRYDKLWGPSQRVVTLFYFLIVSSQEELAQYKSFLPNLPPKEDLLKVASVFNFMIIMFL